MFGLSYVDVILPQALPMNYTYGVPPALEGKLRPGCRVAVQFGRNKKYAALVKTLHGNKPEAYEVKPVLELLDEEPILYPVQLKFWEWMAAYYMCTEGEVMHAVLPAFLKLTSDTRLLLNPDAAEDLSGLTDEEYLLAEALQLHKELSIEEVQQILGKITVYPVINQMLQKKICLVQEELKKSFKPKKEVFVRLHPDWEPEEKLQEAFKLLKNAPKQEQALLAFLFLHNTSDAVTRRAIQQKAGIKASVVNSLAAKNFFILEKRSVPRLPFSPLPKDRLADFTLNEEQQQGYEQILEQFKEKQNVLLHGVTSSGKTMIYIRLITHFLKQGKQVLYLLPEIALTAQIVRRLQKHFGEQIGIYHSKFSNNERVEIWNKVRTAEYKIVLGARSALLLPFKDLGFVILDEEHDTSYKQQNPAPRYHARDAALYYCRLFGAKALLGSATPSLESYYNARRGKYGLVRLQKRYGEVRMPDMQVVDMKQVAFKKDSIRYLSPQLEEAIRHSLAAKNQVILFQNRRGYAPAVVCTACGWIPRCKNCDVSLTYHKFHHRLHCHYCGQQYPLPEICSACGSPKLVHRSFGTERVEDDLSLHFPGCRVERMDYDSVRNKDAHQKLITRFEQQKIDMLIGTQMVVKGLDFDRVNLVGILSVDSLLSYPDFRLNERAFQLLAQVSGRSGRRGAGGKVLLQAMNTTHPVIGFVIRHDYEGLYEMEIRERENFHYPPFSRLMRISLKHRKAEIVKEAATVLNQVLQAYFKTALLGPSVPLVGRVRNLYLIEFMVKLPKNAAQLDEIKTYLHRQFNWLKAQKKFSRVIIVPDVDCV